MAKNRVVFLFMILVSLLGLVISGSRGSYVMLMSLLILAAISAAQLCIAINGVKINETLDDNYIIKGEKTRYLVEISCTTSFFSEVSICFKATGPSINYELHKQTLCLHHKKIESIGCEIESKYRGICHIGVNYVEIYDFLKIFRLKKKIDDGLVLTVCPNVTSFYDEMFLLSPSEQPGLRKGTGIEDYANITGIRLYEHSDSMKRIHWKLSAKKDELLVKNYDATNTTAAAIIIDNRKTPKQIVEKAAIEDMLVEMAVSIIKHNLSDNRPVILDYMGKEPLRVYETTSTGFDTAYYALSNLEFDSKTVEDLFMDYYNPNFTISAIYLLSVSPDDTVVSFTKVMALKGHDISLLHFFENEKNSIQQSLENTGVRYYGACLSKHRTRRELREGLSEFA